MRFYQGTQFVSWLCLCLISFGEIHRTEAAEGMEDDGYPILRLKSAPKMDGKGTDPVWNEIPLASGFNSIKTGVLTRMRQTSFKMGWNEGFLYIWVKCEEPELTKVKVDPNRYRDGWYPDDNIEFFIASDRVNLKKVRQWVTNSQGAQWANDSSLKDSWEVVAFTGQSYWGVEMKLSFQRLGVDTGDFKDKTFYFNLARSAISNSEEERYSCFAGIQSGYGFGEVTQFSPFHFKETLTEEERSEVSKKLNRLDRWIKERLWNMAHVKEPFLSACRDEIQLSELYSLKEKAKKTLTLKSMGGAMQVIQDYDALISKLKSPTRKATIRVERVDAQVKLFLDGKEVVVDEQGKGVLFLKEGMSVLSAECLHTGKDPGVRVKIEGEMDSGSQWKFSDEAGGAWMKKEFNDDKWQAPVFDENGMMWGFKKDARVYMRQIVLWEESAFGKFQCLNPVVKEWLFSEKSTENLVLSLYPLLESQSENHEFVLDIPLEFELLELNHPPGKSWNGGALRLHATPKYVKKEFISRENTVYRRYRILYAKEDFSRDLTNFTFLPVRLNSWNSQNKKTKFYFHRVSHGHCVEFEQVLPVGILPPIRGKILKKIRIQQYAGAIYSGAKFAEHHWKEVVRGALAAGFTDWILNGGGDEYSVKVQKEVVAGGGRLMMCYGNFPIWGCGGIKDSLYQMLQSRPETRAKYFKGSKNWDQEGMFCPSWAVGDGKEMFKNAVRDDYQIAFRKFGTEVGWVWSNWEGFPWVKSHGSGKASSGDESYCFCSRCKLEFMKYAGLKEDIALTDDEIFKNHYQKWDEFRGGLDGKIQEVIRSALAEINKKYMVYSQTQQKEFWEASRQGIDAFFVGCPGNATADASQQAHLDETMKFFQEKVGVQQIIGQRFVYFGGIYAGGAKGPVRFQVLSADGVIRPKSWKNQLIRIVASLHGGVDLRSSVECSAGVLYYIGEATRLMAEFEDLFYEGKRQDALASADQIRYPNLLVLTLGNQRLVLIFNDSEKPWSVTLKNHELKPGQQARVYGEDRDVENASCMQLTVPAEDVLAVHIR